MIKKANCDRCGNEIKLVEGERPLLYVKLQKPREVCSKCAPMIDNLDKKLNQKFQRIMFEIDKEMFPAVNNIIQINLQEDKI